MCYINVTLSGSYTVLTDVDGYEYNSCVNISYKFHNTYIGTYDVAKTKCANESAYLAKIDCLAKNDYTYSFLGMYKFNLYC
jgi:hypothetical protein